MNAASPSTSGRHPTDAPDTARQQALGTGPVIQALSARVSLSDADLRVADVIARRCNIDDTEVLLAVALTVQATRLGNVCLDLHRAVTIGLVGDDEQQVIVDLPALDDWCARLAASAAVAVQPTAALDRADTSAASTQADLASEEAGQSRPLVLAGTRLYLDRYWRYEQRLATGLLRRVTRRRPAGAQVADDHAVDNGVEQIFGGFPVTEQQRHAAQLARDAGLVVVTGGPGTGKTTAVVGLLATLLADDATRRAIVLTPTGKAAARAAQALQQAGDMLGVDEQLRDRVVTTRCETIHRALRWDPHAPTRFRYGPDNAAPFDVVIVDEASMVSLPLMTKLVEALDDAATLVLVGDRRQLASIDAGAVLRDVADAAERAQSPLGESVVTLRAVHRFAADSGIAQLAAHVISHEDHDASTPSAEATVAAVRSVVDNHDDLRWLPSDVAGPAGLPPALVDDIVANWSQLRRRAEDVAQGGHTDVDDAVTQLLVTAERSRVLTALRRGAFGARTLSLALATAVDARYRGQPVTPGLAASVHTAELRRAWPSGTPVMVTRNDAATGLANGDVGVVIGSRVAFTSAQGAIHWYSVARLPACESVFAMTVHKSQGSQFDEAVVTIPPFDTPVLTRELFYTAITRARRGLTLVANEDVLATCLHRPVRRATGLADLLSPPDVDTA